MGSALVPLAIVLAVLVVGWLLVRQYSHREVALEDHAAAPDSETLRYRVPEGQDPVAVAATVRKHGFEVTTDHHAGVQEVVVVCPDGVERDREKVRAAIEEAPLNLDRHPTGEQRIRFADE